MTSRLKTPAGRRFGSEALGVPVSSLVVPVTAALGAAAFFVWKPGVARSMLGSPRALAFTVLIGILVLAAGWLLPRLSSKTFVTVAAQAIPILIAVVLTVLPAFHNVSVDEAFPAAVPTAAAGSAATEKSAPTSATPAPVVGRGRLMGIDHRAGGDVLLVRDSRGYVVRLQSLDVEPGPDYHVHVVPGAGKQRPSGGTHLGKLRGNKGNQNYPVPATVSLARPFTVLIWCREFTVPVAAATIG